MKKKASREIIRVYGRAEAIVESDPNFAGTVLERSIKLRFKTWDFASARPDIESPTPWVTLTLDTAAQLSIQLAGLVETAKRWEPGEKVDAIGPGVVLRGPFEES